MDYGLWDDFWDTFFPILAVTAVIVGVVFLIVTLGVTNDSNPAQAASHVKPPVVTRAGNVVGLKLQGVKDYEGTQAVQVPGVGFIAHLCHGRVASVTAISDGGHIAGDSGSVTDKLLVVCDTRGAL